MKIDDFIKGREHIKKQEQGLRCFQKKAGYMYDGDEHKKLRRSISMYTSRASINKLNWNVEWWILSAGYGFIPARRKIVPYDCSFHYAKDREELKVSRPIDRIGRRIFNRPYDLCIILLSKDYFAGCDYLEHMNFGGPTICFCSHGSLKKISAKQHQNLKTILAGQEQADNINKNALMVKCIFVEKLLRELSAPGVNANQVIQQLMAPGTFPSYFIH